MTDYWIFFVSFYIQNFQGFLNLHIWKKHNNKTKQFKNKIKRIRSNCLVFIKSFYI
jgi:hypothetical protein